MSRRSVRLRREAEKMFRGLPRAPNVDIVREYRMLCKRTAKDTPEKQVPTRRMSWWARGL